MDTTARTITPRFARRAVPLLLGATVATWVGQTAFLNPGENYTPPSLGLSFLPIAFAVVAAVVAHRAGMLRTRGTSVVVVGLTAFTLLLYSIGLGVTAIGLGWVVALVGLFGFVATAGLSALALHSRR